jgi:ATP phosphoribosyltransferase regulatory subunit
MKKDLLHTPEGVRDIYNSECARKLVLQNRLRDVCTKYGYNDIQTPTLEFFDVFNKERGSVPSNEMFKLFDRYGNTLVMRPDMTPSIARTAAKYYGDRLLPVKLCYVGNTFINVSQYYQGKLKENTTIGAELIGDDSVYADFEIISMVIESMKNAGLTEFQVEIGNVAYFRGLLAQAGISGDDEESLVEFMQEKNYLAVDELLTSLHTDKNIAEVLLELPQLFGSVDVLEKAKKLATNDMSLAAIERLNQLYELCKLTGADKYVSFDLGAVSKHSYYTGILFYAYTFGTGEPVIAGGRYDKLLGQFGCDKPSIGYSITVDSLMAAISRQNIDIPVDNSGVLLIYNQDDLSKVVSVSDAIRQSDTPVCTITYNAAKTDAQYCEYARNSQLKTVVKLPHIGNAADDSITVTSIDAVTGTEKEISLSQLLGGKF